MALDAAVPVRFSADATRRLNAISQRSGMPVAQLIRMATETWLAEAERKGEITVPLRSATYEQPKSRVASALGAAMNRKKKPQS